MAERRKILIGEVADFQEGYVNPKQGISEYFNGPIKWLRAVDLNDGLVFDTSRTLSEKGFFSAGKSAVLFEPNTLAISKSGTIGRLGILKDRMCGNRAVINIKPKHDVVDLRYLFYALHAYREEIINRAEGSVQKNLYVSALSSIEIELPDIEEQRRISAVVGPIDDKIELNRRMSATLEELARALYRSWFVDFDPVHARALGQSPAHMDPTTAALFPDSFGPDGLPKGWEREPLAQHVRATRGLSYKGKHLRGSGDGVPLHNLNSIFEGGGYKDGGAKYYDGDFKPRHEIRPGDLIVANTEQSFGLELIGHAALVPSWLGPSGIFSQHLYKVEITEGSPLSKEWVYLALSIAPLGVEIRGFSNGTTVNMLPADAFEIPETAIPPAEIVEKMNEIVRPAFAQQERLREESRTLVALRDALLPRLMSGELRIREAEQQVEEVV
jgi:type I restriction enzyme S subunit